MDKNQALKLNKKHYIIGFFGMALYVFFLAGFLFSLFSGSFSLIFAFFSLTFCSFKIGNKNFDKAQKIKEDNLHHFMSQETYNLYKKLELSIENDNFQIKNYEQHPTHSIAKYSILINLSNSIIGIEKDFSIDFEGIASTTYKATLFEKENEESSDISDLFSCYTLREVTSELVKKANMLAKHKKTKTSLDILNKAQVVVENDSVTAESGHKNQPSTFKKNQGHNQ